MRLIDADKVKSKLQQHRDLFVDAWGGFQKMSLVDKSRVDEIDNCIAEIVNAPTIEVTPVVHGRWIDMGDFQSCSICKATRLKKIETPYGKATWVKTKFCPDCGAKMDGGVFDG